VRCELRMKKKVHRSVKSCKILYNFSHSKIKNLIIKLLFSNIITRNGNGLPPDLRGLLNQ
jgi:hypothetical protein